jgi:hypothetical protein
MKVETVNVTNVQADKKCISIFNHLHGHSHVVFNSHASGPDNIIMFKKIKTLDWSLLCIYNYYMESTCSIFHSKMM